MPKHLEAHGGYLCRVEALDSAQLARAARQAVALDGAKPDDCSLQVTVVEERKLVRLAYDAPFTYGRAGARWYADHHALARILSRELEVAVHAYVLDPEELELVASYGNGRKVGGERLVYEDFELDELEDEEAFERAKNRWPLGHLAHVFGLSRRELVMLPRAQSVLVNLDGTGDPVRLQRDFDEKSRAAG